MRVIFFVVSIFVICGCGAPIHDSETNGNSETESESADYALTQTCRGTRLNFLDQAFKSSLTEGLAASKIKTTPAGGWTAEVTGVFDYLDGGAYTFQQLKLTARHNVIYSANTKGALEAKIVIEGSRGSFNGGPVVSEPGFVAGRAFYNSLTKLAEVKVNQPSYANEKFYQRATKDGAIVCTKKLSSSGVQMQFTCELVLTSGQVFSEMEDTCL